MTEVHWSAFENPLKSYPIIYLTVYYKDCKLPYDTGPDKISIMVIFNNVAIFILTFPFFILQTPLPLLSHISVTGSLKIQTQIQQSTQDAMYRNLQDEPADLVLSQGKKKQALHKLIKVCMFTLRLCDGCLQDFSLTQSLIFTRGSKMFRASVKVVSIFSTFERWDLRWYFPRNCDKRRQQENCKCVGGVKKKSRRMQAHCCRLPAEKKKKNMKNSVLQ